MDRLCRWRGVESCLFLSRLFQRLGVCCSYAVGLLGIGAYELGLDAFGVSGLMLVGNVAIVAGNVVAGPVVDRFGPKRTLAWSLLLCVAVFVANVVASASLGTLCAVMALWSLLVGVVNTAYKTLPPYLVGPDRLQPVNGLIALADNIALVGGPLVGGLVALTFPVRWVFLASAVFTLVAWGAARGLAVRADAGGTVVPTEERPGVGYVLEGFKVTFATPVLAALFFMSFFGFFCYGAFDALESLFYRDVLHVTVDWLGWLVAALGIGSVGGSLLMMRLSHRLLTLRGAALMLLVTGLGSLLYVGTSNVWVAAAGQVVTGLGFGMMDPLVTMLIQERTDLSVTGRVVAVVGIGGQCAGIAPLFAAPFLAQVWGVQPVLVGACAVSTLIGLGFLVLMPARLADARGRQR